MTSSPSPHLILHICHHFSYEIEHVYWKSWYVRDSIYSIFFRSSQSPNEKKYILNLFFVRIELLFGLFFLSIGIDTQRNLNMKINIESSVYQIWNHFQLTVQYACEVLLTNLSVTDSLILQILSLKWYLLQHVFWMTIRLGTKYFFNLKYITLRILVSTWNRGVYRIYIRGRLNFL